jgi:hypothetical protein
VSAEADRHEDEPEGLGETAELRRLTELAPEPWATQFRAILESAR